MEQGHGTNKATFKNANKQIDETTRHTTTRKNTHASAPPKPRHGLAGIHKAMQCLQTNAHRLKTDRRRTARVVCRLHPGTAFALR